MDNNILHAHDRTFACGNTQCGNYVWGHNYFLKHIYHFSDIIGKLHYNLHLCNRFQLCRPFSLKMNGWTPQRFSCCLYFVWYLGFKVPIQVIQVILIGHYEGLFIPQLTRPCFCCRQLWLFVWSQFQTSKKYNFLMCPLTAVPTCLVLCRRVHVCVYVCVNLPGFPWHVWFHASLPVFSPLPVSCRYFIPISTHMCTYTHIQKHTSAWGCELQRLDDILWSDQQPPLCLMTVCVAACSTVRPTLRWLRCLWGCHPCAWVESGGCRCACKEQSLF